MNRKSPRSLAALVAVAIGVLVGIGPATYAQSNDAPTAVILALGEPDSDGNVDLDGSLSFDIDDGDPVEACGGCSYQWEVLTPAYFYLSSLFDDGDSATVDDARVAATAFQPPEPHLVELYGPSIEFQLTVTDAQGATDVATVVYRAIENREPTAEITVTAKQLDRADIAGHDDNGNGMVDENEERYSLEGVIHAPGMAGNDDNEWHIRERSLLVVDGSGSFDPDGPLPDSAFSWELLYRGGEANITGTLPDISDGQKSLSTDEDPDVVGTPSSETIGRLRPMEGVKESSYYLYYRLTVTDEHGASDTAVVKIVIRDSHDHPTVEIRHPESDPGATTDADSREGVLEAGENRYVIWPEVAEEGVTLTGVGEGDGPARTQALEHTWIGSGVEPSQSNRPGATSTAVFTLPEVVEQGRGYGVGLEVVDPSGLSERATILLIVADTRAPTATAPPDIETADGANGGYPESDPPTGVVRLRGFGFDPDGDEVAFKWEQVQTASGEPLTETFRGPRLVLNNSTTPESWFVLPEVVRGDRYVVYVQLTVTDSWGVSDSDVVTIVIRDDDDLRAIAESDRRVEPGDVVLLRSSFDSGLVSEDASAEATPTWAYSGIETHPLLADREPLTEAEIAQGFAPGEWFPNADGTYSPDAGGRMWKADTPFPFFIAPELGGFNGIKLTFELTVDDSEERYTDSVSIAVVGGFFSGVVDGPDFCADMSRGGPMTHPVDSDEDGVADTCSLEGTRRAAIARQYALETLAEIYVEDFIDALHGPAGDQGADETTVGTCATAPDDLDDDPDALDEDVCGRAARGDEAERVASSRPSPIDPMLAPQFFSGYIDGPHFCANQSLGGPVTYAHDSNEDGVADVCALAYTRREAIARQRALEAAFADHALFSNALAAACAALGTLDFGESPEALAADACNPAPGLGTPLPTPTG